MTSLPCASRYAIADGGTLDSAVSCAVYGWRVASCGAAATTELIAAWLAEIVVSTASPLAPPPAAAIAWLTSLGGIVAGFVYLASWVNSAGFAWMTASSGGDFVAAAICAWYLVAVATIAGWLCAKASWLAYSVE